MYGATTGRVGILEIAGCVNQACCVLYGSHDLRVKYVFHWFTSHRSEIMNLASGGGQPNISQELVRSLQVPGPEPDAQDKILSVIREREVSHRQETRLLDRRLALLAERRQALITAAVTGQIDLTTARGADV